MPYIYTKFRLISFCCSFVEMTRPPMKFSGRDSPLLHAPGFFSQATPVVRKLAGRYFFIVGEQLFFGLPSQKRASKNGDEKESRRAGHFLVVGKEYVDLRHAVGIKLRSRRSHDPWGRTRKKSPLRQQSQRDKFFVLSREKCLFSWGCI